MLGLGLLAHTGEAPRPHDIWGAWNLDPLLVWGLVLAGWACHRAGGAPRRRASFLGALVVIGVALVSPLDALSEALASAHMVQHVLLVLVAAPLLALSAPVATLLRGSPAVLRRTSVRWHRRLKRTRRNLRFLREPAVVWLLHVAALWVWHASGPYDAALGNDFLHVTEHVTFLVTAVWFWKVAIGDRAARRAPDGLGSLLVFAMALQGVILSMLLTFARTPWYSGYASTTEAWGLDQLADQQLAGVIMWVPAGLVYVGVGLALFVAWLRASEVAAAVPLTPRGPAAAPGGR